jgi:hypothetical protein
MNMENHGGMSSTEENSQFVHQNSLAILQAESSGSKQDERGKGKMNFVFEIFLFILASDIYFPLNLTTWDLRLYFPSEGRRAADFFLI